MKYENANNLLPTELLHQVQKYAAGKLLYVPSNDGKRNWGEASGYKEKLQKRNLMICNKYANGMTISDLADEYFLSLDSIKKIIYFKKKLEILEYSPTLISAVEYANSGMLEEWTQSFFLFTCNKQMISEQLIGEENIYFGVIKLPLRLVQANGIDEIDYDELLKTYGGNISEMPPLIIRFVNNKFHVLIQNDMFSILKKRMVNAYPAIILIKGNDDYKLYKKNYDQNLFYINDL